MAGTISVPRGTTKSLGLILRDSTGTPLVLDPTFRLWFMAKQTDCDDDAQALIDQELTIETRTIDISHPYHAHLNIPLEKTGALYDGLWDLKIKVSTSDWKSSNSGRFQVTQTIRHGNPT